MAVDDSPDVLNLLQTALTQKGYRIRTAIDGRKALEMLKSERPRLILLDMKMPVMDGWEFAKEFRDKYGRSIPIIVMTAAEDSKLRADEIGADAYLGKPFELPDLYDLVDDTVLGENWEETR